MIDRGILCLFRPRNVVQKACCNHDIRIRFRLVRGNIQRQIQHAVDMLRPVRRVAFVHLVEHPALHAHIIRSFHRRTSFAFLPFILPYFLSEKKLPRPRKKRRHRKNFPVLPL